MKPPFRSAQDVVIHAPLAAVWAFNMDLSKIPDFHPRVVELDFLSGKTSREAGAAYRCHLTGGKHTCVEQDIEIIPMKKIVTVLPEDTLGISKVLSDYTVETVFERLADETTRMRISHFYSTRTWKAKLLHALGKRKIARETQATLNAIKAKIETAAHQPVAANNNQRQRIG